ncbi:arabinose efflux permease [Bacteroides sp. CAG:927]|jgi:Cyanate permease|nr:arabinose efflux permease [Bacteroides sp. CAG:927]
MIRIPTGNGSITLPALLAIWSISLVVNLPGLAVSPMLGNLDKIFPHVGDLEIQLLTVLPNLLIIPFVLFSGKLSESKDKVRIVVIGLAIYLVAGILYFFAESMPMLIATSCLLGCGCGLVIPLAAGLIADTFSGKYRMQQLGIKSGISNMALVAATFAVGWLNHGNWHTPFLVYLIPIIPLALILFVRNVNPTASVKMNSIPAGADLTQTESMPEVGTPKPGEKICKGFIVGRIMGLLGLYAFVTYTVSVISYYLPFLIQEDHLSSDITGTVTALFYLAVFLPGFILPYVIKLLGQRTSLLAAVSIAAGLLLMSMASEHIMLYVAAVLMGFGYGVFQPVIYDKATYTVTDGRKSTLSLAIVLSVNYIAVAMTPFVIDFFRDIIGTKSNHFPFILNFALTMLFAVVVVLRRKTFTFRMSNEFV